MHPLNSERIHESQLMIHIHKFINMTFIKFKKRPRHKMQDQTARLGVMDIFFGVKLKSIGRNFSLLRSSQNRFYYMESTRYRYDLIAD
jgi:hypothetical protein